MRLIDIDNITALDIMHNVICDKEVAHKMLDFLQSQPTIQPQGIDKDRLIELINRVIRKEIVDAAPYREIYEFTEVLEIVDDIVELINQQLTSVVPDTNDGKIPQSYKDRVEHVIKVLEFCKQRHIDIVKDLPHTVEIERGTISAYSMALKVVRECLLQPYKESEE